MPSSQRITIVGAGACGVAAFAELVTRLQLGRNRDVAIRLIERTDELGRGLAFGTDQPGQLLNTESRLMGLLDQEPGDYRRWLARRRAAAGEPFDPDGVEYSRRSEYRAYMQDVLADAMRAAEAAGVAVEVRHGEAVDIEGRRDDACVVLADGTRLPTDYALLALGTPKPDRFAELRGKPGYFDFPWPSRRLIEGIGRDQEVVILGSSLSAIDTLMTLLDCGHRGRIRFVSKDGMLPHVEIPAPETGFDRRHFTLENVHRLRRERGTRFSVVDVFRLFIREAEEASDGPIDWRDADRRGRDAAPFLFADIAAAESGREPFQRILTSARHEASDMWNLLGPLERKRFAKWLGPHFSAARFVMPMVNARRVAGAVESGQLTIHGGVDRTRWDEEAGAFETCFEDGTRLSAPVVVNATGTAMKLDEIRYPLVRNLVDRGWLHAHPIGGAQAERATCRLVTRDRDAPRLYAVGQLLNGVLRDTNSVWFNVGCTARAVDDMLHRIDANAP